MDSSTPQAPRKRAPVPALGPWAITQEGLELCLAVWSRGSLFAAALERARAHVALNGFDAGRAEFLDADVNASLRRFIDEECLVSSPVLKATTSQLFEAFEKWRVRDGAEALSQKAFGQAIDRHGYPADKPVRGKRWRTGIALRATEEEG